MSYVAIDERSAVPVTHKTDRRSSEIFLYRARERMMEIEQEVQILKLRITGVLKM
jgi:hypothetical protein